MQSQTAFGDAPTSVTSSPARSEAGRRFLSPGGGLAAGTVLLMLMTGCADIHPYVPPSEGHISAARVATEPEKAIPPPARTSDFVPPPKPRVQPQTYSVVVNEVPVKELLLALARDTKQNIDIHPSLQGLVSLNAINETLPAILDRVAKQVNMRYRKEGDTIIVTPDTPYAKTYRVNYVNMTRNTSSTIGVSGQITASGTGTGTSGGAAAAPAAATGGATNASTTVVTTTSHNDFWTLLRDNIRALLNSTMQQSLTAQAKADRLALIKQEQEVRIKQMEAASRAGQGAAPLANIVGAMGSGQQQTALLPDDVVVNPVAGTLTVNATEKQHRLIEEYLTNVNKSIERQVLIEATIVEVTLSQGYQGGIDWSRLARSGGISFTQSLLGGFNTAATAAGASAGNSVMIGYQNQASRVGNLAATVRLLQEFGKTHVLSSPKLMTLNNQTALLKVVDNIVYFELQAQTNTTQGVATTTFNSTPKTVSVGVVMGVTPQINDNGQVTLSVRPTISRVIDFKDDPNPSLTINGQRVSNPVPEIQVREMESVLQVNSGQTVILGGLMQDNIHRNREQVPGADRMGAAGELLRFRDESAAKTELVIFLRPTVITNPSLTSDELKFFQRFLPRPEKPPSEKTGAAQ